jgi:hypothetical protein
MTGASDENEVTGRVTLSKLVPGALTPLANQK